MRQREMHFPGCRDVEIHGQGWLPGGEPTALVVISHGLAEHGGRYAGLAEKLVASGYGVYAIDHRAHGRSGGTVRANVDRFDYLVSDLGTFVGRAQRQHPGLPTVLLGHSMGGLVALAAALKNPTVLRALVLSAPALAAGEAVSGSRRFFLRAMSSLAPGSGALTLPAAAVSRDPQVVRAYESDPLVHRGPIPARTVDELLLAMAAVDGKVHQLRLPVLIQHGTADKLVPAAAVQPIYQRLGTTKTRTLQLYEGLYHEVYNEPERERVIGDLVRWIESVRH
jgi:acylglycerol lipase